MPSTKRYKYVALNPGQASRPQVSPVQPSPSAWPQGLPVQCSATPQPWFKQTTCSQSCFATPRPLIWPPSPIPPINTPQASFTADLLQRSPSLIRSCYGCSQALKPGGTIANPPLDLVIISRMQRVFRDPSTLEMIFREGNVYFHVQQSRIRNKQPYFVQQMVSIPHGLLPLFKTEHSHFQRQFGLHV